jgi:hypothetical protein
MTIKEMSVREYIERVDFNSPDWSIYKIKEEMRRFLGEEPAIDVIYKKDVLLNEVTGKAQEVKAVDKIQIVFTDLDDRFKKLEFKINEIL